MKTILFLSRDPGGTNCLIPIILTLRNHYICRVYAKDMAYGMYVNAGIECVEIPSYVKEDYLDDILETIRPDIVLTGTSSDEIIERQLWEQAKRKGIRAICIMDSWCNYIVRFSKYKVSEQREVSYKDITYLPDYIIVMDDFARQEMVEEGFRSDMIYPLGQPYLEYISERYESVTKDAIKRYLLSIGAENKKVILFASDNLSTAFPVGEGHLPFWGYDEESIFNILLKVISETCNNPQDYILLVRPHPKESTLEWETRVRKANSIRTIIDYNKDAVYSVLSADLVVGMFSMLLTEAAIAGKNVMSIQIGARKMSPFLLEQRNLLKPYYEYNLLSNFFYNYFSGDNYNQQIENSISFSGSTYRISYFISQVLSNKEMTV